MQIIKKGQTAILISTGKQAKKAELRENLEELTELALSAGLYPLGKLKQSLKYIDSAFLIGEGKRKELEEQVFQLKPHYAVFNHSLSGVQTRNLEKLLKTHVLDRSQLILEIFAQRAESREGKLQVELAQLLDQRMVGAWLGSLSRQGGSGTARGPGEKALEIDRRQARNRIKKLKNQLEKVKKNRAERRRGRQKKQLPSFALLGYTNSGKSSLLNRLAKSHVETKNQPFMTLDPKTRKLFIPGVKGAVVTDTVGFIRDIPPHLISAFKATLEESACADVILHVVDISQPQKNRHIQVVDNLIEEFGWSAKPRLYVFNKMDLLSYKKPAIPPHGLPCAFVSAKTGWNVPSLLSKMRERLGALDQKLELFFPKEKEYEIYNLKRQAKILKKESFDKGTFCSVQMPSKQSPQWKKYFLSPSGL